MGAGHARERVALAGRQDPRGADGDAVRNLSGILPGASLPFAGWARSHKTCPTIAPRLRYGAPKVAHIKKAAWGEAAWGSFKCLKEGGMRVA